MRFAVHIPKPPFSGSYEELPPVAAKLCDAAKRLLARQGIKAATVKGVTEEAGEYSASVDYYFGGKRGLIAAVAESVCPVDACIDAVEACEQLPPGEERIARQTNALREMAADGEAFRAFFELFPHILRDEELRRRLDVLYEWYRDLDVMMFGISREADDPDVRAAASVVVAAVDGLAFQACLKQGAFDLDRPFAVLGRMLTLFLEDVTKNG